MRSEKFCSQLDWKSKAWFFTFLNVYWTWIEQDKGLISQLLPSKFRYFADQNGPKGDHMKTNFDAFSNTKMKVRKRAQKVDEKNGVIGLISFFTSCVIVLKLPKIVHFLQIFADLSKKCKSIKAVYSYPSERSHVLSEKSICYRDLRYWELKYQKECWISRNLMEFIIFKC